MKFGFHLLAVFNAVFFLCVLGCGDESGGCSSASEKKETPAGGGYSGGSKGGGSGSAELVTSDKKGRVPSSYQRPADAEKSTSTISAPVIAVSSVAVKATYSPAVISVTRRKVDGIADRVELKCRIKAVSLDGQCSGAKNYLDIKQRCCPSGLIERCKTTLGGVVIVGRGCEQAR